MNYKLLGIITALLLTTGFSDSFAVQITIQTDGSFAPGEKVELSGTVAGASEGDLAAIEIKDDSGEITLSLWNEDINKVDVGTKIKIGNGYTNSFRGETKLNVGRYGTLDVVTE